jgi:hypothetical protein
MTDESTRSYWISRFLKRFSSSPVVVIKDFLQSRLLNLTIYFETNLKKHGSDSYEHVLFKYFLNHALVFEEKRVEDVELKNAQCVSFISVQCRID